MTEQEIYVLNALSGKPIVDVVRVCYLLPDLIKAVEESGWVKIDDEHQPPVDTLVHIWNESFQQQMVGKYIGHFWLSVQDVPFEGDAEYNEEDDDYYHPEGWYVFCEHAGIEYVYGLCLDNITHFKLITEPAFRLEQK